MFKHFKNCSNPILFILVLAYVASLTGCQSTGASKLSVSSNYQNEIIGSAVAVYYAPDGRLWRLIPTKDVVYVDYSDNNGMSFQQPKIINPQPQKINVWPENPPAITISHSGRIYVLYYANAAQKATTFFSFSDDNGKTFSTPVLISDHATTDMHYMDRMLVNNDDNLYLFWHDTRHENHNKILGASTLSLFFSTKKFPGNDAFINRKISDGICSCCRTATDLSSAGLPVLMARMVFNDGTRDHALIRMNPDHTWSKPLRVTRDQWKIEACPEHGPAISVDNKDRSHLAWFTLGTERKGIFYAYTDDFGKTISPAMPLGNTLHLPSHPAVKRPAKRLCLPGRNLMEPRRLFLLNNRVTGGKPG